MSSQDFNSVGFLRKYYAGQAIIGLCTGLPPKLLEPEHVEKLAEFAFKIADKMAQEAVNPAKR
jgi:hypothetical protein